MFSSYPVLSSVYVNTNKQTSCPTFAAENSKPAFLTLDVLVLEHKRDCRPAFPPGHTSFFGLERHLVDIKQRKQVVVLVFKEKRGVTIQRQIVYNL